MHQNKHITVCGHYGNGHNLADGQTVKTQTMVFALKYIYGSDRVSVCDTYNWKKQPFNMFIRCIQASRDSSDIIMLPADKGVYVFLPIFYLLNLLHNNRLHYSVIGGWLFERIEKKPWLIRIIRSFTTVQVETKQMQTELMKLGIIDNVRVVPNFKTINALTDYDIEKIKYNRPLPLCIFSRVMKEKGIEDAIRAVSYINKGRKPLFRLDIFGAIDSKYQDEFNILMNYAPPEIKYKGVIDSSESVKTLKNYYLLLFPTQYTTEGLPGSIIDSYAAGLPVLSSRWNSFSDVIDEGITGYGYELGNIQQFIKLLNKLEDTRLVLPLKSNCIKAFEPFSFRQGCLQLRSCVEME